MLFLAFEMNKRRFSLGTFSSGGGSCSGCLDVRRNLRVTILIHTYKRSRIVGPPTESSWGGCHLSLAINVRQQQTISCARSTDDTRQVVVARGTHLERGGSGRRRGKKVATLWQVSQVPSSDMDL
ncbi:hypothetical protein JTE90_006113 [Oedothorax gibbosus]|uniref:Uncharacterized protein n=1 Tax=Oedothorax gibbosus TaxID=931172 RepID=A0AAV6V3Z0_9ARAC|nr:hypothetical protein JTE90_006113 [Oedothorax gibbosus]